MSLSVTYGSRIFWRYKDASPPNWMEGFICGQNGGFFQIGTYRNATHGVWVKLTDIEYEEWK